ncbi:MAG: HAD hydrolase-like protein [Clostridia bacterium]|nr:HAD hydrolase-like protein [Clostridia bacterium]
MITTESEIKFTLTEEQYERGDAPFVFEQNFYFHIDDERVLRARRSFSAPSEINCDINRSKCVQIGLLNKAHQGLGNCEKANGEKEPSMQMPVGLTYDSINRFYGDTAQDANNCTKRYDNCLLGFLVTHDYPFMTECVLTLKTKRKDGDVRICTENTARITQNDLERFINRGITAREQLELLGAATGDERFLGTLTTQRRSVVIDDKSVEFDKYSFNGNTRFQAEYELCENDNIGGLKSYFAAIGSERVFSSKSCEFVQSIRPRKEYDTVLFDFDGTLVNSFNAVSRCFRLTLEHFGKDCSNVDFSTCIGPPLTLSFTRHLGAERANEAMTYYKRIYDETDASQYITLYEGVASLLSRLKKANKRVVLTTNKSVDIAKALLVRLNIAQYFDYVAGGIYEAGIKDKYSVLKYAREHFCFNTSSSVLVGDSSYDAEGAALHNIDTIAVSYGFGKISDMLCFPNIVGIAQSPDEVFDHV